MPRKRTKPVYDFPFKPLHPRYLSAVELKEAGLYFLDLKQRLVAYIRARMKDEAKVYRVGSKRRFTLQKLADRSGMPFSSLHHSLSGHVRMSMEKADMILRGLDITVNDLLHRKEKVPVSDVAAVAAKHLDDMMVVLMEMATMQLKVDRNTKRRYLAAVGGVVEDIEALYALLGLTKPDELAGVSDD